MNDDIILDILFIILAVAIIFFLYVLPVMLIVVGAFQLKENKKIGKTLLIIGIVYLCISIVRTILNVIYVNSLERMI